MKIEKETHRSKNLHNNRSAPSQPGAQRINGTAELSLSPGAYAMIHLDIQEKNNKNKIENNTTSESEIGSTTHASSSEEKHSIVSSPLLLSSFSSSVTPPPLPPPPPPPSNGLDRQRAGLVRPNPGAYAITHPDFLQENNSNTTASYKLYSIKF